MKLDNFKKLLLKKAEDNPNLQLLIKYMRDDYLIDHTVESLNKMARSYSNKNPNHAVMHFGTYMDPETEGNMVRDALSHHASHYKAALNAGNEKLADQHMKKIFEIMHMSEKLTRDGLNDHSGGKLKIEAIDPKPWERQKYTNVGKSGKMTDTKGWSRSLGDYSFMRGAPHESYGKEVESHGHKGAYPLNQIKVNGKYLHIDDVEPTQDFVPHAFDKHPVMKYYKASPTAHTSEKHQEYLKEFDAYGDDIDSYLDHIDTIQDYDTRGANAPDPIHKPLLDADQAQNKLKDIMGESYKPPKPENAPKPTETKPGEQVGSAGEIDNVQAKLQQIMGKDYKAPTETATKQPEQQKAQEVPTSTDKPKVIRKPGGASEVSDVQAKLKQIMGKDYKAPKS